VENLSCIYDSKYFVKIGGRTIRGNSVIESISLGTLVLVNPTEVMHSQLLPPSTWVHSVEELKQKIVELDGDPSQYASLLKQERALLDHFAFMAPLESLMNCFNRKREAASEIKLGFSKRLKKRLRQTLGR
jgi:hypothetical protein